MKHDALIFLVTTVSSFFIFMPGNHIMAQEKHKDSLAVLTSVIQKHNIVTSPHTGKAARVSGPYQAFILLLTLANNDEFYNYTQDRSASLRVYAFYALKYRKDDRAVEIEKRLLEDSSQVEYFNGCMKMNTQVYVLIKGEYNLYNRHSIQSHLKHLEEYPDHKKMYFEKYMKSTE